MRRVARWSTILAATLGIAALVLRSLDQPSWRPAMGLALALLGARLALLARDALRGDLPWTRLLVPAIVWLEAAGTWGRTLWQLRVATALALEVTVLTVAIAVLCRRDARSRAADPEDRLATALTALVPPPIARLAAIELVLVGLAVRFLAGGWRRPPPPGIHYHRASGVRMLLPVLPLLGAGDALLLELVVMPHAAGWLRVVVHALAGYGLLWLVGVYASLRARPHRLVDGRLELHRGVLRSARVDVADIVSLAPLPAFADGWKQRAYVATAERFDLGGAPVIELRLRDHRRLLLAVDDPPAFERALHGATGGDAARRSR